MGLSLFSHCKQTVTHHTYERKRERCTKRGRYHHEQELDDHRRSGHDDQQEQPSPGEFSSCPNACQQKQDQHTIFSWRNDITQAERCRSYACCCRNRQYASRRQSRSLVSSCYSGRQKSERETALCTPGATRNMVEGAKLIRWEMN